MMSYQPTIHFLDYTFPVLISLWLGILALRTWQKYFQVKRKLNVDLIPLYVKLLNIRKQGVKDAYLTKLPTRW
jgi:hypothetical protein